ncbi:VWA containing CoxE family protein [Nostocoides japonicum T1-X7]|uniref:VWA containing CoxE family protein n=1 Tax=Nostocoides japonicum T1-X7 TaxID=1194083 RepID=A0A077LW62_9MICO|nr:VWA domain-containing protein [Tetrasphaera japonica]CCH77966.1 VWA containing CoxE family protein [Tetrasphaera japonica T1-X7]
MPTATAPTPTSPEELLLGFARAARAAGLPVTADRETALLEAVALVGIDDGAGTYWAGRATLCSAPDHLERYDRVFAAWFHAAARPRTAGPPTPAPVPMASLADGETLDTDTGTDDPRGMHAVASRADILRHRDVATLTASEKADLATMFGSLPQPRPLRRSARRTPWRRGEIDAHRTLRRHLELWGEPAGLEWRRRDSAPRRVVLLVDVSGSMAPYADALLRLAHRWSVRGRGRRDVHVFTMGTRLTDVTRALDRPDPEQALAAAGDVVPDWSGGTRLGETLKAFLDQWGRRGLARGAVVVVFSDGWERGGAELLAEQMARLRAVAHRVVWVNPHKGKPGYLPVQQGIVAVLPYCDDLLAGHSYATFEALAEVVDRA